MYEGLHVDEVSTDEAKLLASLWMKDVTGKVLSQIEHDDSSLEEGKLKDLTLEERYITEKSCNLPSVRKQGKERNVSSSPKNKCAGVSVVASKGWPHGADACMHAAERVCYCRHDWFGEDEDAGKERKSVTIKHAKNESDRYRTQVKNRDKSRNRGNKIQGKSEHVEPPAVVSEDADLSGVTEDELLDIWGLKRNQLKEQGFEPDFIFKKSASFSYPLSHGREDSSVETRKLLIDSGEANKSGNNTITNLGKASISEKMGVIKSSDETGTTVVSRLDPLAADFTPDSRCRAFSVPHSRNWYTGEVKDVNNDGDKVLYSRFNSTQENRGAAGSTTTFVPTEETREKQCEYCRTNNSPNANWCFECGRALHLDTSHDAFISCQTLEVDKNSGFTQPLHFESYSVKKDNSIQNLSKFKLKHTNGHVRHSWEENVTEKMVGAGYWYPILYGYDMSQSLSPPTNPSYKRRDCVAMSYDENLTDNFLPLQGYKDKCVTNNTNGVVGKQKWYRNSSKCDMNIQCGQNFGIHSGDEGTHAWRNNRYQEPCMESLTRNHFDGGAKEEESRNDNYYNGLLFDLENSNQESNTPSFSDLSFVNQFVQAGIERQVQHWYGISPRTLQQPTNVENHAMQTGNFWNHMVDSQSIGQPLYFRTDTNNLNRMYRKKKFYYPNVQPPPSPRNRVQGFKQNRKESRKSREESSGTEKKDKASFKNDNPSKAPPTEVPKLAFDNLDSYDEILTLIRTSREEALPFLCLPEEIVLYVFSYLTIQELVVCTRVCKQFHRISSDESLWKEIILRKRNDISDATLEKISRKHPVSLTITQCHGKLVTAEGLRNLFRESGDSLEELDFSGCNGGAFVGEAVLLHISTRCTRLRSLDISWCNVGDAGIESVADVSPRLESLCINGCQAVTDAAIKHVVKKHGESLRILEVFGCFNITQSALLFLAQHCPNLETLNIGQCHKITDVSMSHLALKLKNLENLDLRGCKKIRDSAVKDISQHCLTLSTLVLANCPLITDASLLAIAANVPLLRRLDVCGCGKITDKGVQALTKSCYKLEVLDLSSTSITQKSVLALANHCSNSLQSLKLSFCYQVNEASILHLVKKCRSLKLLHLYGCKKLRNLNKISEGNPQLIVEGENSPS